MNDMGTKDCKVVSMGLLLIIAKDNETYWGFIKNRFMQLPGGVNKRMFFSDGFARRWQWNDVRNYFELAFKMFVEAGGFNLFF